MNAAALTFLFFALHALAGVILAATLPGIIVPLVIETPRKET